ncbi:hypothetical protein J32TS2_39830 [Shouchella clausii]|nr:hypothetical protein J32TS2_39830 [Shouchella clausii]
MLIKENLESDKFLIRSQDDKWDCQKFCVNENPKLCTIRYFPRLNMLTNSVLAKSNPRGQRVENV